MTTINLTPRQRECVQVIESSIRARGVPPSYDEIATRMGLRTKSGVHRLIDALVDRGAIVAAGRGRARSLTLVRHSCPNCGAALDAMDAPSAGGSA